MRIWLQQRFLKRCTQVSDLNSYNLRVQWKGLYLWILLVLLFWVLHKFNSNNADSRRHTIGERVRKYNHPRKKLELSFFYFKFNYEVNPLSPPRISIYQVLLLFKQSFVIQECSTLLFNRAGSWILHFSCTFQTWNDLFPWKKSKYITILSIVHLLCLVKSRTQHIKSSCYFFHKKWHWFSLIKKVFIIVSLFLDLLQVKHINVPSL